MGFPNTCAAKLTVSPCEALADQPQIITAEGLKIASKYTLVAQMERQAVIYQSYAHYVTDSEGTIDVSTMTSLGGSYEGVEPMGLIWFLEPLIKKPSAKVALKYQLIFDRHWTMHVYLLSGHVTPIDEDEPISVQDVVAKTTAQRSIDHPRVSRYDVRDGRLKATLFVPEGQGPFLGVLDLFGWLPGVIYERRAALLAARGYVTLALAYAEYEGQLDVNDMQLDYFLEALKWLDEHPKVAKCGVTIASHCMSSYIALHLAAICSKVKAIVAIGTPSVVPFGKVTHEGRLVASWPGGTDLQGDALTDVIAGTSRTTFPVIEDLVFPMENLPDDLDLLLIAAEDDKYISPEHTRALANRLGKRNNVKVIINKGEGHSYSEPYVPLLRGQFLMKGRPVDFGGQKYVHEKATEQVWIETLHFLEQCKLRLNVTGDKQ